METNRDGINASPPCIHSGPKGKHRPSDRLLVKTEEAGIHHPLIDPMKTSHTILNLLAKFQATTSVLAEELRQPARVVDAFCKDLEIDGLCERTTINGAVTVWRITDAGREVNAGTKQPAQV